MTSADLVGLRRWVNISSTSHRFWLTIPTSSDAALRSRESLNSFVSTALLYYARKTGSWLDADPIIYVRREGNVIWQRLGRPSDPGFDSGFRALMPKPTNNYTHYELMFNR